MTKDSFIKHTLHCLEKLYDNGIDAEAGHYTQIKRARELAEHYFSHIMEGIDYASIKCINKNHT